MGPLKQTETIVDGDAVTTNQRRKDTSKGKRMMDLRCSLLKIKRKKPRYLYPAPQGLTLPVATVPFPNKFPLQQTKPLTQSCHSPLSRYINMNKYINERKNTRLHFRRHSMEFTLVIPCCDVRTRALRHIRSCLVQ